MNVTKWTLAVVMTLWLGLSFIFLCGDDDPNNPMNIMLFLIIKVAALGSMYLWGKVFKLLCDNDCLPKVLTETPEDEEEDWD